MAIRAGGRRHVAHQPFAVTVGTHFIERLAQPFQNAVKPGARSFSAFRSVEQQLLLLLRQMFEWFAQVDLVFVRCKMHEACPDTASCRPAPVLLPATASTSRR